ncbi:RNP-1 like RNA-binding protein [Fusarium tricinctum]|uniref:RNP-1 like RNA-binding protein n=2 Tax=Fusarium tricinctum species complex TaxID=679429 RepID=A0A8K0RL39_9HYPO|nr:RNP-1 like RNA-binding protein [Fusarium avenaceum]KAH7233248.1 RNP-1 like RNA-binding protein [Fusarium tricinctum]
MSTKLFIGGLSWNTTDESLQQGFAAFGEVTEARVIIDRETNRSRGFGFVTFSDEESANKAIAEMDGQELDGRQVRVNKAEEKAPRSGGGRGGFGGGSNNWRN